MIILAILFFVTALVYAAIGFGGGSTYNALLVLGDVDYRILPSIALACNIIVVAGGVWRFGVAGRIDLRRIAPWLIVSAPAAWIGGRLPVSEAVFVGLLGVSLTIAGVRLLTERPAPGGPAGRPIAPPVVGAFSAGLGLLSGVVGIGGGIFLAPILHFLRWGAAKEIAGACSLFILVNSASGLAGQAMKLGDTALFGEFAAYWTLLPAVLIGGQIGSRLGAGPLPEAWMKRLTALLILYVAVRLLIRWQGLIAG